MQNFQKADFFSDKPYEYLRQMKKDPFQHEQALAAIQENARAVGVRNFRKLYATYEATHVLV